MQVRPVSLPSDRLARPAVVAKTEELTTCEPSALARREPAQCRVLQALAKVVVPFPH